MINMSDDFFNQVDQALSGDTAETPTEDTGKIKIGDNEFSQEELAEAVGLRDSVRDLEGKWNTKIDKLMPSFTKISTENSELKKRLEDQELAQVTAKATAGETLSQDEVKKQALAQARELGIVTKEDLQETLESYYANRKAGENLLADVTSIVEEAKKDGKPQTTQADLLEFMDERGIRNPNDAYEIMFKEPLKEWERKQLAGARPSSFVTQGASTAGGKTPPEVKVTRDNLEQLVRESFNG